MNGMDYRNPEDHTLQEWDVGWKEGTSFRGKLAMVLRNGQLRERERDP